jgi:flagellar basal body-associated protein FliL
LWKKKIIKKIIILIIALFIIAAGMGAYFIFQKPTPQPQIGKCGDGVCDEFERANPNLCLKDCTITAVTSQKPIVVMISKSALLNNFGWIQK